MVWYLYTVVKYIRRMHFSFVEFASNSYENKRLLVGSENYEIIQGITVLHDNFVYRSIDVTHTAMTQRNSGLNRNVTDMVEDVFLYTNRSRTNPCALA